MYPLFLFAIFNMGFLSSGNSFAEMYRAFDLEFEGELQSYHVEDLNNDGLKDILLILNQNRDTHNHNRWIYLYIQNSDGFGKIPNQKFKVLDEIILFDIGDVYGDFQKEFVFFADDGVYSYKLEKNRYDISPHFLFKTESIFFLSNTNSLQNWNFIADLNGDNIDEVFIPQITKCDIYFRNPASNDWLINEIALPTEMKVEGLNNNRYSVGNNAEAHYSTPYIFLDDFNLDGKNDLMGVYEDSLVVYCQDKAGYFSQKCRHRIDLFFGEIWKGAKIQRTRIGDKSERVFLKKIIDLNKDGILDVVSMRISTKKSFVNPYNELRIHFGRIDSSKSIRSIKFNVQPDQIINPGGTQLVLDILDLNRDGKYDLLIPVVKVGLKNIISMLLTKSVGIQAEAYLMQKDGFFSDTPDIKSSLVVRFSYRGGMTSPVYEIEDFNGDGYWDILSSMDEKMLIFFWGNEKIMHTTVGAKYYTLLPQNGEKVQAIQINNDHKCDIIITFNEDNSKHKNLESTLRILLSN